MRGSEYLARDLGPTVCVAPGASATLKQTLWVGPKLQHQLEAIHPELGRAADFGKLTFLAQPLFWLLEKAHSIFGNWGFAIIAVTFLLKLAFYPLSEIAGPLDGQDEDGRAAHEGDAGAVQGRSHRSSARR